MRITQSRINFAALFIGILGLGIASVQGQVQIPGTYALASSAVDTSKKGFLVRTWQSPGEPNTIAWAEDQLAGLHGANTADKTVFKDNIYGNTYFDETGVLDYWNSGGEGNFPNNATQNVPGLPNDGSNIDNYALEVFTLLDLAVGTYTMGVNSDDGFRVRALQSADPREKFGITLGQFDGGRGVADTTFAFTVAKAGLYPFRMVYEEGGGDSAVEWFTVTADGTKHLINDSSDAASIKAYRTGTLARAALVTARPAPDSTGIAPNATIEVALLDGASPLDASTVKLSLDGTALAVTATKSGNTTSAKFTPAALLASGSSHTVSLTYTEAGSPVTVSWNFTVTAYVSINATAAGQADTTKKGFLVRTWWASGNSGTTNKIWFNELMLAGLAGDNAADTSKFTDKQFGNSYFDETGTINYWNTGGEGNFPNKATQNTPGLPADGSNADSYALEVVTYLDLPAGLVTMGVNSDDGFRVYGGGAHPFSGLNGTLGQFDQGRGVADTLFSFVVEKAGVYPFRMIYEEGGGDSAVEWFSVKADGTKVLINDTANGGFAAYRQAKTLLPYVKSATPAAGALNVRLNPSFSYVVADTTSAVQSSSVQLFLDGQKVTPTVNKAAGASETTVTYKPTSNLSAAVHTVQLIYSDNASPANAVTNQYTFSTVDPGLFNFADDTKWSYNREGVDLGTAWKEPNYDDSKWPTGLGPLGDNNDFTEVVPIRTYVDRHNDAGEEFPTLYIRGHFNFPLASTAGVKLTLRYEVDDGAVFYLNGVEVSRFGLSAGQAFDFNTLFGGHESDSISGPFDIPVASLKPGDNVFAVEVHQSSLTSSDIVYGGQLTFTVAGTADKIPPTLVGVQEGSSLDKIQVSFSEQVELASAQNAANYTVTPVAGGANLTVTSAAVASGTNVVLTTSARTAGAGYSVTVKDVKDLAGNILSPNPSVGTLTLKKVLFTFNDNTLWSYNRDGVDLGTGWKEVKYDDSKWPKGVGPLGENPDNSELVPIRTAVSRKTDAGVEYPTLYVRGHFTFSGKSTEGVKLNLTAMVDDGAVFWLNGVEVYRTVTDDNGSVTAGFGTGPVTFATLYGPGHEANHFEGPVTIPAGALVPGDNVLAVEVHQTSLTSSDIVYGAELTALIEGGGTPPTGAKFAATTIQAGKVTVTWTGTGTLQSATSVIGPWTDLGTAKSPFTENVGGTKFFRVKQ